MIWVIAPLLVTGCLCAPSSSSISSSTSSSSSSTGPDGVVISVIQKFSSSSGLPNITSSLGSMNLTQGSVPSILSAEKTAAAIQKQTDQAFAAIKKQNLAFAKMQKETDDAFSSMQTPSFGGFSFMDDFMPSPFSHAIKSTHKTIKNKLQNLFPPMNFFPSPFLF